MNARIIKSIVTVNILPNQVLFIRTQYTMRQLSTVLTVTII